MNNTSFINYVKKMFIKNKDASISIMAAILIPTIMFMSLGIADACKIINEQLKIDRVMKLYGDFQLSNYDRELFERYGLFGFEENDQLDYIINENFKSENVLQEISSNATNNIYELEMLKTQINSFSTTRVPIRVFNELKNRLEEISSDNKLFSFDGLKESVKKIQEAIGKIGLGQADKEIESSNLKTLSKFPSENIDKKFNKLSHFEYYIRTNNDKSINLEESHNNDISETEATGNWREFLKSLSKAKSIDEEINESSNKKSESGFLISLIENIEKIHELSKKDFVAPIDKLILLEYTVNQFNSHVRGPDTVNSKFITLTGQDMSKLDFNQTHEAEQILLAVENKYIAMGIINTFIYSTRVLSNYFSINNDVAKMSTKRAIASGISAAIAFFTLGLVIIDTESITQVLVLLESITNAFADLKQIKAGEKIALVGNSDSNILNIKIDYIDYLRFLGLFRGINKQYFVMSKMIKSNLSKDYYTEINFTCEYSNKFWSYIKKSESRYEFQEMLQK